MPEEEERKHRRAPAGGGQNTPNASHMPETKGPPSRPPKRMSPVKMSGTQHFKGETTEGGTNGSQKRTDKTPASEGTSSKPRTARDPLLETRQSERP